MSARTQPLGKLESMVCPIRWEDYVDKVSFTPLCTLVPGASQKRLDLHAVQDEVGMARRGLVFAWVVAGRVFGFGHSKHAFKQRLAAYNAELKASASGAINASTLQTLLTLGQPIQVHAYFPKQERWQFLGHSGHEPFPPPRIAKRVLLSRYRAAHGTMPLPRAMPKAG